MYSRNTDRQAIPEIHDRRELLKIKLKSLAAEAKIIRHEEKKVGTIRYVKVPAVKEVRTDTGTGMGDLVVTKARPEHWRRVRYGVNPLATEMHLHRTVQLREHARLTHIAYGLIRGKSLEKIEGNAKVPLTSEQWARIYVMVRKYGSAEFANYPMNEPLSKRKAA